MSEAGERKRHYRLSFPHNARCMFCGAQPVARVLNLRIRRGDTGASYGPNIDNTYMCLLCGDSGMDIYIDVRRRSDGLVHTEVRTEQGVKAKMTRPMSGGSPDQGSLW